MYLDTEIQILESISKILSRYICIAILPSPGNDQDLGHPSP
ncbi:MAG: hypothetical protein PV344_06520 [Anaplasma sp.]|nr:hypothetical protein [Anaplasma sp.]